MLRYIGKNIFHVIAYLNPIDNASIKLFLHLNDMVDASIPARYVDMLLFLLRECGGGGGYQKMSSLII